MVFMKVLVKHVATNLRLIYDCDKHYVLHKNGEFCN